MKQGPATASSGDSDATLRWVGAYAEKIVALRGRPDQLKRSFERSSVPMVIVDGDMRYVYANPPARLAFRKPLEELRQLTIANLTPEYLLPEMEAAWERLIRTGCTAGRYDVASPAGTSLPIVYYAVADALPGLYLIAFAPAEWQDRELVGDRELLSEPAGVTLTPRELEILQLAADGCTGPMIAGELFLSGATVKTHFEHVYEKLNVRDRAAAVAKAMRLGLIS
jgi:DNA-binding CsgD family transcriptional regulator